MSRKPCCIGEGLKKGAWTAEEDKKLISYIHENGEGGWRDIPQKAGLKRCGKSCRLRWANYLKPDIKRGEFSYEEEQIIMMLHASRGNKWSVIARHLPKRTDNEIKNYWNTHLKKRLIHQGIDPVTHKLLISNPNPETPKTSDFHDDSSNPENSDDQSHSDSLNSKKRCFNRSNSTSKLLNKVATRAASIGNVILSASIEGTFMNRSTTLSPCLNDDMSETSQFQIEEFDPMNFDFNDSEYDFSQFLEQYNEGEEAENINGGYNQDLLMSDVSSTNVDEDNLENINNSWSSYLVDHSDFVYDDKNFI